MLMTITMSRMQKAESPVTVMRCCGMGRPIFRRLRRHTYNDKFIVFTEGKGFSCEIVYYETPVELSNALIRDEVDAIVNSYIGTPEDERVVESFGQTAYYIMVRKEDHALVEQIDAAIDNMNVETPNWRKNLYNKYYGFKDFNTGYTDEEQAFLQELQQKRLLLEAEQKEEVTSECRGKKIFAMTANTFASDRQNCRDGRLYCKAYQHQGY